MSGIVSSNNIKTQISVTGLAVQLAITLALGFVAVMVFSLLRPKNQSIYARRLKYAAATTAALDAGNEDMEKKKPPRVPEGWFAWFPIVRKTTVEDLQLRVGLDAAIFVEFLSWSTKFFLITGLVFVVILVPINILAYTGRGNTIDSETFFVAISMVGARYTLTWIWAHVAATYIMSLAFYYALWRLWTKVTGWRQRWMKESREFQSQVHSRTIMLLGAPASWKGSEQAVLDWMRGTLPAAGRPALQGTVVTFARKLGKLPKLIQDHEKAVRQLESALEKHLGNPEEQQPPPMVRPTWFGAKVDAIKHYTAEMNRLNDEIVEERARISAISVSDEAAKSSVVFVTFPNIIQMHRVHRLLMHADKSGVDKPHSIQFAPPLRDVIWMNAQNNRQVRSTRRFAGSFITFWVIVFGMVLVSLIASLITLAKSDGNDPASSRAFLQFVAATLTPAILAIFFLLLPWIFRAISFFRGKATRSGIERDVLRKFFLFLFINNFIVLVSALLYNLWYSITVGDFQWILNEFRRTDIIITNIGTSLIDVSSFWMSYILIKGVGVLSELAQAVALLIIWLRRSWFIRRPTPRQKREFARPPDCVFSDLYAIHLFAFVVALMFGVAAPVILLFGCCNFALSLIVYKYQLMYVYAVRTETGGLNWFPLLFNRLVAAVIVLQLVMLLATNVALGSTESLALVPLPVVTLLLKWVHASKLYDRFVYMDESRDAEQPEDMETKGRILPESAEDRAERYTHHALNAPLPQVLVSRAVATNGIEKVYLGEYVVEGNERKSRRLNYTIKRRRDSLTTAGQGVASGQADVTTTAALADSDMEEDELFELMEAGNTSNPDEFSTNATHVAT